MRMGHSTAVLVLLVAACVLTLGAAHNCIHDKLMNANPSQFKVRSPQNYASVSFSLSSGESGGQVQSTSGVAPIRIVADFRYVSNDPGRTCTFVGQTFMVGNPTGSAANNPCDSDLTQIDCWGTCTAADVLTPDKQSLITDTILSEAVSFFSNTLSVRSVQGNLLLTSTNPNVCGALGGVPIPPEYVSVGVQNADLVLFVTARPTTTTTVAYAVQCQEDNLARPIAGQINFNPRQLQPGQVRSIFSTALYHLSILKHFFLSSAVCSLV